MTPGDSVSVVKLNPQQQLSHASYTTDSWSADRQPAQFRQDQRPAATVDQHLLLHHTYVPKRADKDALAEIATVVDALGAPRA